MGSSTPHGRGGTLLAMLGRTSQTRVVAEGTPVFASEAAPLAEAAGLGGEAASLAVIIHGDCRARGPGLGLRV